MLFGCGQGSQNRKWLLYQLVLACIYFCPRLTGLYLPVLLIIIRIWSQKCYTPGYVAVGCMSHQSINFATVIFYYSMLRTHCWYPNLVQDLYLCHNLVELPIFVFNMGNNSIGCITCIMLHVKININYTLQLF